MMRVGLEGPSVRGHAKSFLSGVPFRIQFIPSYCIFFFLRTRDEDGQMKLVSVDRFGVQALVVRLSSSGIVPRAFGDVADADFGFDRRLWMRIDKTSRQDLQSFRI